jgi:hypothetical protein
VTAPAAPERAAAAALRRRLDRRRRLALAALWWEALWPAFWPPLGVLGVGAMVALAGLPLMLPGWWHLALLLLFLGALGWAAWRGFAGFRRPGLAQAERWMERRSGLSHRPLAALADRPATGAGDPASLALWRAHQARAAAALRALRVGPPRPGLAARDPRALRAALLVALIAAFTVAGPEAPERLRRAVVPSLAAPVAPAPALRLEAWITPPAYTGAPPVFLDSAGGAATVPLGSRFHVALSGGPTGGVPELVLDQAAEPFRALDAGRRSFAAETTLAAGGSVGVRRDGRTIATWSLAVQADAPPRVSFPEAPARAQRGLGLRVPWRVEDDWGVVALRAEFRLKARPEAPPHVIDLTLPAASVKEARGAVSPDLSAHPWAGLEVEIRLVARDGAAQEGVSATAGATLPERSFNHPVARELIALRKGLSLDPTARGPARDGLDRITAAPERFEDDGATFLALRAARHRLARDRRPEAVDEVQAILWEVALALEEGRADRTARALAQAREALRQALEEAERERREAEARAARGEPQTEAQREAERQRRAELERRIHELREAIRRHLEALAERLQRENNEALPFDPQQRLMDQRDMDRRTQRMREAAREGRTEDVERELAELEEMLRALEEGRVAGQQDPNRQRQRQRGQQQMGAVQDMVRRETEMLDRSERRAEAEEQRRAQERRSNPFARNQFTSPSLRQQQDRQALSPEARAEQEAREAEAQRDARIQRALRRALGELMQQFGDLTGEIPDSLGRADQAMREADEALRAGRDPRAHQRQAIRELQEGGRQMARQLQRQFGMTQEGEDGDGEDMAGDMQPGGEGRDQARQQGPGRDPLGRRTREGPSGLDDGSDTRVPDEAELLRARRIQDELRRRGAQKERPPAELDYIDRLLKRF